MDKREHYLSDTWKPYPAVPKSGVWVSGELLSLQSKAGQEIIRTLNQGRVTELTANTFRFVDSGILASEILRAGDKIAIKQGVPTLELLLLSPCLRPSEAHRIELAEAQGWQNFLDLVRVFFKERNFVEIGTPSLVVCPGTEPTLDPVAVDVKLGGVVERRFLPTSPELHLKKLLAQGWTRIFEIRSCFRDGEISAHHQPEFTMMEFYRAYEDLNAIEQDLEILLERMKLSGAIDGHLKSAQRFTVAELFKQRLEYDLKPNTSFSELFKLCAQLSLPTHKSDSWNDLFHRVWLEKIEPWIATQDFPIFIGSFPPSQAALSRVGEDGWAERVELFWRGLEIANGFHELNDPAEQRKRFEQDLNEKQNLGKAIIPLDEDFMNALLSGMPPASGIAVGLERLFMAARNIGDIKKLKAFPYGNKRS